MKEIKLTQGQVALVDDLDFERVNAFKWYVQFNTKTRNAYALTCVRQKTANQKRKRIQMHTMVLAIEDATLKIVHRDGNRLNNVRANLMIAEQTDIGRTQRKQQGEVSTQYKGVAKSRNGFEARIRVEGKRKYIGFYATAVQAAHAYNKAAARIFGGTFSRLNSITEDTQIMQTHVKRQKGTSRYKGVSWTKRRQRWKAAIHNKGNWVHIGYFLTEVEAAKAYNAAAKKYRGKKAKLNIIDE